MPNVDDIGKLFESAPGNITVPNPGLTAEYAWNFEAGIIKKMDKKFRIELNAFTQNLLATVGWENMTNQRYRPYSSGIVAAGSNFMVALRAAF